MFADPNLTNVSAPYHGLSAEFFSFPLGSGTFGSSIFGDSDGDLVLDTLDAFPDDASETKDTDGDGVGDNSDAFPGDGEKTQDFRRNLNNAVLNSC